MDRFIINQFIELDNIITKSLFDSQVIHIDKSGNLLSNNDDLKSLPLPDKVIADIKETIWFRLGVEVEYKQQNSIFSIFSKNKIRLKSITPSDLTIDDGIVDYIYNAINFIIQLRFFNLEPLMDLNVKSSSQPCIPIIDLSFFDNKYVTKFAESVIATVSKYRGALDETLASSIINSLKLCSNVSKSKDPNKSSTIMEQFESMGRQIDEYIKRHYTKRSGV